MQESDATFRMRSRVTLAGRSLTIGNAEPMRKGAATGVYCSDRLAVPSSPAPKTRMFTRRSSGLYPRILPVFAELIWPSRSSPSGDEALPKPTT